VFVTALLLFVSFSPRAQDRTTPPIPIWSGVGRVPAGYENQKVFLTPDEHSVIILWPNPNGTVTKRRFPIHNEIDPSLHVQVENSNGGYRYEYNLENGLRSKDSLKGFSVVIFPDPDVQLSSTEWTKGIVASGPHERVGIPGSPSGVLAHWTYNLNSPVFLQPGATTAFTIVSQARPGLTTAETEHFPHIEPSDGWPVLIPDEIADQLNPVLQHSWIADHRITVGPRYSSDDSAVTIATDYLIGIHELIRIHRLESGSSFVKEVIANLDAIASGSSAQIPITQKPHSELEAEILNALQLSLRFVTKAGAL
jgi:hypothetical protein